VNVTRRNEGSGAFFRGGSWLQREFRHAWMVFLVMGAVHWSTAQVLTPAEIKSPEMRALQEKYFRELQGVGAEIQAHIFPYPFYFSRVLDLELPQQERADQRSLRFDNYGGMTVVELTGNYFGAYSVELVSKSHRALRTFQDVMFPILAIAVPAFQNDPEVEGFAMEISHHIRGKAMGMNIEHPENLVLALSKDAAVRLVTANNETDRQAAILDGHFYFNGEPFVLYLSDEAAKEAAKQLDRADTNTAKSGAARDSAMSSSAYHATRSAPGATPLRDISAEGLAKIQAANQKMIDLVARELDEEAHFISYATPAMVPFKKSAYLEFSVVTTLPLHVAGSRYKLAALAFDEHISRLVRPIMAYFKGELDFDGVAFSTTFHQGEGSKMPGQNNEAVEFFFPVNALRCYEIYDCTGQQLIDEGAILINGERVRLDLEIAEAGEP
jgi:hypothetical protein